MAHAAEGSLSSLALKTPNKEGLLEQNQRTAAAGAAAGPTSNATYRQGAISSSLFGFPAASSTSAASDPQRRIFGRCMTAPVFGPAATAATAAAGHNASHSSTSQFLRPPCPRFSMPMETERSRLHTEVVFSVQHSQTVAFSPRLPPAKIRRTFSSQEAESGELSSQHNPMNGQQEGLAGLMAPANASPATVATSFAPTITTTVSGERLSLPHCHSNKDAIKRIDAATVLQ